MIIPSVLYLFIQHGYTPGSITCSLPMVIPLFLLLLSFKMVIHMVIHTVNYPGFTPGSITCS